MSPETAALTRQVQHEAGRQAERDDVVRYVRERAASALNLAKRGRFSEAEGQRLNRWLGALADDLRAELHVPGDPDAD